MLCFLFKLLAIWNMPNVFLNAWISLSFLFNQMPIGFHQTCARGADNYTPDDKSCWSFILSRFWIACVLMLRSVSLNFFMLPISVNRIHLGSSFWLAPRMNVLFRGPGDFPVSTQTGIPRGTLEIVIQEVLWSIRGSYSAIWSIPLTNVKWHSDPWPTLNSQPIGLSTNFMTLIPSLNFTDYEWFPWSIC